jgi:ribosomal protein S14
MKSNVTEKPKKRRPEVWAKPCPKCGSTDTRVRTTFRILRYCVCKTCNATWRQSPGGQ